MLWLRWALHLTFWHLHFHFVNARWVVHNEEIHIVIIQGYKKVWAWVRQKVNNFLQIQNILSIRKEFSENKFVGFFLFQIYKQKNATNFKPK